MMTRVIRFACVLSLLLTALVATPLGAADKYWGGGTTDIPDGTPVPYDTNALVGTWNATIKNWAASPDGATYTTFADGDNVQLGYYTNLNSTTITLESDFDVSMVQASMNSITSGFNYMFNILATSPQTLTPGGSGTVANIISQNGTTGVRIGNNVSIGGSAPITKLGGGVLELTANSDGYTGAVNARQGTLALSASGSLSGAKTINCVGRVVMANSSGYGGNDFAKGDFRVTAAAGANDKLADDAVITLSRGGFPYWTSATGTETIGRIVLDPWGTLGTSDGSEGGILTLSDATAGITRGAYGVGTLVIIAQSTGIPKCRVRVPNGIATDTLLPWIYTSRAEFMMADSANNNTLTRIAATDAATDLTTWDTTYDNTSNVRIGNGTAVSLTGSVDEDTTVKSLAFNNTAATTLTIADGKTLTLADGALAFNPAAGGNNQIIAGGSIASGKSYLYINATDSGAGQRLTITSSVAGVGMDVIKSGLGQVSFDGPDANTYSGTTYANAGIFNTAKVGGAVAIPGDLVIQNGASVGLGEGNQIATTASVTINTGGLLVSRAQTFGGTLTINGGTYLFMNTTPVLSGAGTGLAFNGGYICHNSTATGTLNLQTDVGYAAGSTTQARFERYSTGAGNIELDGGNRTFNIADSTTLANGVPEMVVDTTIIPGSPAGGSIAKTGAGTLQLTDRNTYTGGTTVDGGVLQVSRISAPAQSGLTAFTSSSGQGQALVVFNAPVAGSMVVRQPISGASIVAGRTVLRVLSDYEVICNGANRMNVSPDAAVDAIERAGTLGTGAVTINNTGTVQIDQGVSITNFTVVNTGGTLALEGELADAVVNNGTVKGNGAVLALTNAAGAVLAPGASVGVMTISGSAVLQNASVVELEWSDSVTNDIIVVNGDFSAQGQPVIKVLNVGGTPTASTQVVLKVTGTYTGPAGGYAYDLPLNWSAITDGSGGLINLGGGNYGIAFIPEPGLLGLAFLGLLALVRNRK
ncbi:hypothetical protein GX586_02375 [bacterium]|nr:hypothetical protein [bacterium]